MGKVAGSFAERADEFPELRAFDDQRVGILESVTHAFALAFAVGQAKAAAAARRRQTRRPKLQLLLL